MFSGHNRRLPRWAIATGGVQRSRLIGGKVMGPAASDGAQTNTGRAGYLATRSFRPFEAEKWVYLFAPMVMVSPVAGFRP